MSKATDFRLPRRTSQDTEDAVQSILAKFEETSNDLNIMRMLANAPTAFRPFVLLCDALITRGVIPTDVREVVILNCAALTNSTYEWEQHAPIAAAAGITAGASQTLMSGDIDKALLTGPQLLAVEISSHLIRSDHLPDESWQEAVRVWGERGAAELLLIIGIWGGTIPIVLRGLDLHTERDHPSEP